MPLAAGFLLGLAASTPAPAETLVFPHLLGQSGSLPGQARHLRSVAQRPLGRRAAGQHTVTWDGRGDDGRLQVSGMYLARLETSNFVTIEKMALLN